VHFLDVNLFVQPVDELVAAVLESPSKRFVEALRHHR